MQSPMTVLKLSVSNAHISGMPQRILQAINA